jgi:hypothetical protein
MEHDTPQPGWGLWAVWVLANAISWLVGMGLTYLIGLVVQPLTGGMRIAAWGIGGMVTGSVFGITQWFLFRPMKDRLLGRQANWWVAATILGWGAALAVVTGMDAGGVLGYTVSGAVVGISVGIAQWFVLRLHARRAEWWGLANTFGWIAGLGAVEVLPELAGFMLAGAISGTITGAALIWLLRSPPDGADPA